MSALHAKKVLLGISGSIAAYKTPILVRALVKAGAEVQVIMTPSAASFVTPLSLSTVSNKPVLTEFVDDEHEVWNNHVSLGLWADLMLIAPASANTLSKMAQASCDNLLMATYLSARCPVYFAPAMDLDMHQHPATQEAISKLESRSNIHIPSAEGPLASGLEGVGRMQEPEEIVAFLEKDLKAKMPWLGKKVLITAGPTYESIDPVRFIGNQSSGKMGYAVANQAAEWGAEVVLVSGPTDNLTLHPEIRLVPVTTADQMHKECLSYYKDSDVVVMAAAVADFKPKNPKKSKIKKRVSLDTLSLEPTVDILKDLGAKKNKQFLVGFALETEEGLDHARQKMTRKNLDAIVLNSLADHGAGFGHDTNKITFIKSDGSHNAYPLKSKKEVALDLLHEINLLINE
ncbi:MAG: bifunctional phosphopantothenoylcysteine decarboxylase/phosphopantothenate--cysteine ligase CoaBC [Flavobacteriaceae bacterium]|jgi:phosphopantothenoylcysteine decarboxylase/phosphopantothenate--cysteine ligase